MDGGFDVVIKNTKGQISIEKMKATNANMIKMEFKKKYFFYQLILFILNNQILKFVEIYFFMHQHLINVAFSRIFNI